MKQQNITEIIHKTLQEFLDDDSHGCKSPWDINNGLCEDFAMAVIDKMGGYDSSQITELWFDNLLTEGERYDAVQLADWGYSLPEGVSIEKLNQVTLNHCFIVYEGRYYDAECSEGVGSPFSLPLVLNALRARNLYP